MKIHKTTHMGIAKATLVHYINEWGGKEVFPTWKGTDEELIKELIDSEQEVWTSCSCVKDKRGACTGVPE